MNHLARSIAARVSSLPPTVRLPVLALAIAGCATLAATALWSTRGHLLTHIDYVLYDRWAQTSAQLGTSTPVTPPSPGTVLVLPDDAAPPIPWDRRAVARTIAALSHANVSAIGLAESFTAPAEPEQGGAEGDALLAEAMADSARVVVTQSLYVQDPLANVGATTQTQPIEQVHPSWPARSLPGELRMSWGDPLQAMPVRPMLRSVQDNAAVVAQDIGAPDVDGTWRRLPLVVSVQDRLVPAFGLALHATAQRLETAEILRLINRQAATQDRQRILVPTLHPDQPAVQPVALSALLQAVHQNNHEQLRS